MEIDKKLKGAILNIDDIGGLLKALEVSDKFHSVEISDITHFNVSRYKSRTDKTPMPSQKVKIGRFFRSTFDFLDDSDIEYLSNKMVAYNKVCNGDIQLKVLKGEDIYKVYNQENYYQRTGTLGNSCMRHAEKLDFLNLYVNNDNCEIVIYEIDGKIASRALLWTLDDGSKFLDRVYSVYDYMNNVYESFAIDNKYGYFKNRQYLFPNENGEYVRKRDVGPITLNYIPELFPYLDTFFILYNNKLYSYEPEMVDDIYTYKQLRHTNGHYHETNLPIPLQRGLRESYRQLLSPERTDWLVSKTDMSESDIQYLFNLSGRSFIILKSNIEKIINTNSKFPSNEDELSEICLKEDVSNFKLGIYKNVNKEYPEHFYNEDGSVIEELAENYRRRNPMLGYDIVDLPDGIEIPDLNNLYGQVENVINVINETQGFEVSSQLESENQTERQPETNIRESIRSLFRLRNI